MALPSSPGLTTQTLRTVLRENARIDGANTASLATAVRLESLGLITTIRREFTRCVNPNDLDYHQLSYEERSCRGEIEAGQDVCPDCGRQIEDQSSKQHFSALYLQIVERGVREYITALLGRIPVVSSLQRTSASAFAAQLNNGRTLEVVLLNKTTSMQELYSGIYFGGGRLYIYYADYDKPPTNVLNDSSVLWLGDILTLSDADIAQKLLQSSAPSQIVDRLTLEDCDQQFAQYVQNVSWQDFEQVFLPNLLKRIIDSPEKLQTYLIDLQARNSSILGDFPVSIGGAGQTDTRLINKFEYMSTAFSPKNIADAKRYGTSTRLTSDNIRDVLHHLNQISRDRDSSAIIFVSTDEVESAAWATVSSYRNTQGYWQIVILPKYLVLELLVVFDAFDLIQ